MAGADIFHILIEGQGGHGALPHQTADPVVAAAALITSLQTIVARNVSPLESAVVSVTRVKAGETFNVIPQTAELSGTIRYFDSAVHDRIKERFTRLVEGLCGSMGCSVGTDLRRLTPPVINEGTLARKIAAQAALLFPEGRVDGDYRSMVSEDMAFLLEKIPGCYFLVGSANPEKGLNYGHHHPRFDFDEQALPRAAALMASAALEALR